MDLGQRIAQLRSAKGFKSPYALAKAAGIPLSVVYDLEGGKTRNPHTDTLQKIADALGVPLRDLLAEPEATEAGQSFSWFWQSRFAALRPGTILEMRNAPVEARVKWCLTELLQAYPIDVVADRLGTTREDISAILSGTAQVTAWWVDRLTEQYEVPAGWLINGTPPPLNDVLREVLQHPEAGTYLLVIQEAMEAKIIPELLLSQVRLWRSALSNKPST